MIPSSCRRLAILSVIVVLSIGFVRVNELTSGSGVFSRPVYAGGITVATDEAETVFTASEDGKTIYMWQCYSSKPPKYLGKAEAILRE